MRRDHPRIRGTNQIAKGVNTIFPGSSPHTRDKCPFCHICRGCSRIIPAYAGQIISSTAPYIQSQDHPRIRGTNCAMEKVKNGVSGSSPHTRDKFIVSLLTNLSAGIIPAYAGQISPPAHSTRIFRDHPRIRGTNMQNLPRNYLEPGSSPHTRDKSAKSVQVIRHNRIIPAYAGQILKDPLK